MAFLQWNAYHSPIQKYLSFFTCFFSFQNHCFYNKCNLFEGIIEFICYICLPSHFFHYYVLWGDGEFKKNVVNIFILFYFTISLFASCKKNAITFWSSFKKGWISLSGASCSRWQEHGRKGHFPGPYQMEFLDQRSCLHAPSAGLSGTSQFHWGETIPQVSLDSCHKGL